MREYCNPNFPTKFINNYILQNEDGLERIQTYCIFRFLSSCDMEKLLSTSELQKNLNYKFTSEDFHFILDYLSRDLYFSPAFREHSFDHIFLLDAITMSFSADQTAFNCVKKIIATVCPNILAIDFANSSQSFSIEKELEFYAAMSILSFEYPVIFPDVLPQLASIYQNTWHFTCEDFVLYDFMNEYFEIEDCRNHPQFIELIDTLSVATLKAHNTTIQQCVSETLYQQFQQPRSKFACLYYSGALALQIQDINETNYQMFRLFLDYAVTYELRNNLFDFHLDEDRIITLDNWKEKLKWYHIQYDNAYEHAISAFYTSTLSQKLLKTLFEEHISIL